MGQKMTRGRAVIFAVLACAAVLIAQNETPAPLAISTGGLPEAVLYSNYYFQLNATGGTAPLKWSIAHGSLPAGVTLDEHSGVLAGIPIAAGAFNFTVRVWDASQHSQIRDLTLAVAAGVSVEWTQMPAVSNGGIYGSVRLESDVPNRSDLTFIVVAVNEIGKAFVLGYQQLNLQPGVEVQELNFGSNLPTGTYLVHVDAIAEVPATGVIYAARLQTSEPLQIASTP
jgi:hypothetical protein